jgi:hypothetical protein
MANAKRLAREREAKGEKLRGGKGNSVRYLSREWLSEVTLQGMKLTA